MGEICINGLRLTGHHGVLPQERRVGNEFEVNIRVTVPDSDRAMSSDDLVDTINYAEIVEVVKNEMAKPSRLIENVAGRIRKSLMDLYGSRITCGEVTVAKLAPPIAAQLESVAFTTRW